MTKLQSDIDLPSEDASSLSPDQTLDPRKLARSSRFSKIFVRDPLMIFLFATFAIIIQLFYTTDFRVTLENFFFDIRTNWMPSVEPSGRVIMIAIDDISINTLEKDPLRIRTDSKKRPYLRTENMIQAASILANTESLAIGLLMPEHAFPAADLGMGELAQIIKYDHRIIIGTNGYNQTRPNLSELPPVLSQISSQVAGYETFRSRSNAIVRDLPFTSFRGLAEVETLPVKIAEIADPTFAAEYGRFTLKFRRESYIPVISLSDFLKSPDKYFAQLKDKVVIVGYTIVRDAGFQTTEHMLVNTPLTGLAPTIDKGISTTWLAAMAVDNLLKHETIRTAGGAITLIQTILVAVLCGLSWELGSLTASVTTFFIWGVLLTVHGIFYSWFSLSIPLADTFLATILISIFGAIRRLKFELMTMARQEASTDAKSAVASVQSHFLAGFASWLKTMTSDIVNLIRQSAGTAEDAKSKEIYRRAFAAGEDFGEYLEAIRQIPEMEDLSARKLSKEMIDVSELLSKILRRFEVKLEARKIPVVLELDENAIRLKTSPQLIDSILFNLISNAIKYSPDESEITIRCYRSSGRTTVVSVSDKGPGIPEELRDRIFERFYRIRDDRMYKAKGTGLGLYLCKYFAEKLGGRIEVISSIGEGSEFRVVLPWA